MRLMCGPDQELKHVMHASPSGQFDVHGAVHFKETIPPRLTNEHASLIVDMSGIDILTSAGVGALITVLNHLETLGGQMTLFGCNKKVHRVLQICELETVFNVRETVDDARAVLNP